MRHVAPSPRLRRSSPREGERCYCVGPLPVAAGDDGIKCVPVALLPEAFGEGLLFFAEFLRKPGADFVEEGALVL